MHAKKGAAWCTHCKQNSTKELQAVAKDGVKVSLNQAHCWSGHQNEVATRKSAKFLGWNVTSGTLRCEACSAGKAKQKNVPKLTASTNPGTKDKLVMNVDMSTVKAPKAANKKSSESDWAVLVDRRTNFKISSFHDRKSDMVKPMLEL